MAGTWVKLAQKGDGPGARSSHAVAVFGDKAYVFGGEFTPRVPVDNKMYVFDLKNSNWTAPDVSGDVPPPRVGVTMTAVGSRIYIFGGRDLEHKELNELYSFDTVSNHWTLLSSGDESPPARSYHAIAADEKHIYVFGGCGDTGRRNDLWMYDTTGSGNWTQLPLPGENCLPRGGPGLAAASGKIWVLYGFSGEELDDVHCFDIETSKWTLVETTGEKPGPRSVFSTAIIGKHVIIYGGEIDPSDLGHLGAGKFSQDVFALDTGSLIWTKLDDATMSTTTEHPGPRGWCAFSSAEIGGRSGLLIYGGNSPTNDRLGDIFFLAPDV